MPRNRYKGAKDGYQLEGVSLNVHQKGRVYYVCNSSVEAPLGIDGSDGNHGLSPERPLATINAAIDKCTAGRGDKIIVLPGHAESVANATTIVPDVAGIQIIGQGVGEERPIITFATATTANIPISAANIRISGIVFKCNIASQVAMLTVTADDVEIDHCSFREGTSTGLNFITVGAGDGDSDRFYIHDCDFYMPTAGNGDHAIEVLFDMVNGRIEDCEIDGDFDEGSIALPAAADAQVNLRILRCNIKNRLTNVAAIDIDGTASSGLIQDCLLRTDTQATALDSGSLAVDNVRWADETDQVSAVPVLVAQDSASNILGADDSDNAFASTNVAANRDGSVLERLEAIYAAQVDDVAANLIGINDADNVGASNLVVANVDGSILERLEALMDPLSGYNPRMGFGVTKVSNLADGSGTDDLFTVTGRVLITSLTGEVTTVIGGAATLKIRDITNSVDLCAATTIDTDAVGTMYALTSISANILNGTGATPVVGSIPNITGASQVDVAVVGDVQAALTLSQVLDAADTGAITWRLTYIPLVASATVAAAA